jgi:hypothetical protein
MLATRIRPRRLGRWVTKTRLGTLPMAMHAMEKWTLYLALDCIAKKRRQQTCVRMGLPFYRDVPKARNSRL